MSNGLKGLLAYLGLMQGADLTGTNAPGWRGRSFGHMKSRGSGRRRWRTHPSNYETKAFNDLDTRNAIYRERKAAGTPGLVKYSESPGTGNVWYVAWPRGARS
jgi:hypothetical protein